MESNEQDKLTTKWKQTLSDREQTGSCQRGGAGGWVEKGKGLNRKKMLRDKDSSVGIATGRGLGEEGEGKGGRGW